MQVCLDPVVLHDVYRFQWIFIHVYGISLIFLFFYVASLMSTDCQRFSFMFSGFMDIDVFGFILIDCKRALDTVQQHPGLLV